jgi:two-component system, cell cycle sensor histidine kinase and response regulator CckA
MSSELVHLLLVEDNPGDARLLQELLRDASQPRFTFTHAGSLSEAFQNSADRIDIILLDLSLPDTSGLATIGQTRGHFQGVPIVVLTGNNDEQLALQAVREGAQDYLVKGALDEKLLVRALRYAIERHQLICQRKEAESQLQKLAAFIRCNPNPILEFLPNGRLEYFNEAAQELARGLGNAHPRQILPPDTVKIVQECLLRRKHQFRLVSTVNKRTFSWSFVPMQGLEAVLCYVTDITELQNLEAQLRHSQKLESIGQLASGIAHDFNNILTIVYGHTSMLLRQSRDGDHGARSAMQIALAAERGAKLTRQLLSFSRKQLIDKKSVCLHEIIASLAKMLEPMLGEDIKLELKLDAANPIVCADASMIEQVLLNLAVNSRDAMPNGGSLTIATEHKQISSEEIYDSEPAAGQFVRVRVTDTGCGIPAENFGSIFEPFFTTKDVGKGSGLGLATAYGIVKQHGGWITVSSEPKKGTTFEIFLPNVMDPPARPEIKPEATNSIQGSETILLVEDEPQLREILRLLLEDHGYHVLEASSGVHALKIWDQHKWKIQLLVSDVVMPDGIRGGELAQRLQAENPGLKVILTSGYAPEARNFLNQSTGCFLQKPFHCSELLQLIRRSLDPQPAPTIPEQNPNI